MSQTERQRRARLVGRDKERRTLRAMGVRARASRGGFALVTGEAGIGKSALVRDVVRSLGTPCVWVHVSDTVTPPYEPVRSLVRALMQVSSSSPDECSDQRASLAPILPEISEPVRELEVGAVGDAVACLLRQASRAGPLTVVLEDAQWADKATLELLPAIDDAVQGLPAVVFVIYRSDEVARGHALWGVRDTLRRKGRLREIALRPLDVADVKIMLRWAWGGEATEALASMLHDRTDGLPFFVEELALLLDQKGGLVRRDDGIAWDPEGDLPLPATVRDAVLFRLDRLSVEARRLLEACAVLGGSFEWDTILRVAGDGARLDELLANGAILSRDERSGTFRHALVQEVVYQQTTWTRRRDLHLAAAEHLEASGVEKSLVARHWLKGGDTQRARRAYLESATTSCAIPAHRDAYDAGQRALDLWPDDVDDDERLALLDRMGECAQVTGMLPEAARAWKEAASRRKASGDAAAYARTLSRLATSYGLQGTWSQAMEVRERAAAAFAVAGLHAESAEESLMMASHVHTAGRFTATLEVLDGAARQATLAGRSDVTSRILALKGASYAKLGRVAEGRQLALRGLQLALRDNHDSAAVEAYQRLASAVENASEYESAEEAYSTARTFCDARGAEGAVQYCNACVAGVLWHRGEWSRTVAVCEDVMASHDSSSSVRAVASAYSGLVLACRGESAKARPLLIGALTVARSTDNVALQFTVLWGLALAEAQEDAAAAMALGDELRARWEASEEGHYVIPALRWFATFYAAQGKKADVHACAEALSRIAAAVKNHEALASLAHALGEAALTNGDATEATHHFERARLLLDGASMPYARAHTMIRAAAALTQLDRYDEARALLVQAQRIARALGARPLVASCAEGLATLPGSPAGDDPLWAGLLTRRQMQVGALLVRGLTDKAIAKDLEISPRTVEMHVGNILAALGCQRRGDVARHVAARRELER